MNTFIITIAWIVIACVLRRLIREYREMKDFLEKDAPDYRDGHNGF